MTIFHSILLGLVEGLTEFLPVSSTGHLILASRLLSIADTPFAASFEIIIQLGAILAVVVLYWKKLWQIETIKKLAVAFIPTGIIGLVLYKIVKTYFLGNVSLVVWMLFLGGVALIVFERWYAKRSEQEASETVTYRQAFLIGVFQSLAMVPGVSRSAATIVGGLSLGLKRSTIVEFSFLLAVPTMLAATVLDVYKNAGTFSMNQAGVLAVGFVTAFAVAMASIAFLLRYVRKHDFTAFGAYRIILAIAFWLIVL